MAEESSQPIASVVAEVWNCFTIIPPALIPHLLSLQQFFEMFGIRQNPSASGELG
jgi:hypothetical protein